MTAAVEAAGASRTRTVQAVTALLFCSMAANFTPTPLYPKYQELWSLSASQVSVAFSAYAAGVLVVLVSLGGLSDLVGRLPTLRGAAVLVLASLVALAAAPSYEALVGARFLQGLGTGIASSAGAAAIIELHPRGVRAGAFRFTIVISVGIAVGPLVAGLVADRFAAPLVTPYVVVAVPTLVATAMLVRARVSWTRGAARRLVRPVRVPRRLWLPFAAAAVAITSTNVAFGAFGSFGADLAHGAGWTSPAAAGGLVSLMLVAVAAAQVALRRLAVRRALVAGCAAGAVGWALTWAALTAEQPAALAVGIVLLGAGAGVCLLASATAIGAIAPVDRRAELQAAYLTVAFLAVGLASLGLGAVVEAAAVGTAVGIAVAVDLVLALCCALLLTRNPAVLGGLDDAPTG